MNWRDRRNKKKLLAECKRLADKNFLNEVEKENMESPSYRNNVLHTINMIESQFKKDRKKKYKRTIKRRSLSVNRAK
jgi:hypothetical protein